jgi:acyl-CoA thioesterase I
MTRFFSFILLFTCVVTASNSFAISKKLLIVGDSLSAGYNMPAEKSWPLLLNQKYLQKNIPITIINASISGDTTGNGLARLPALLKQHKPDYLLIALGANDGLRGFSPRIIIDNLTQMITLSQSNSAQALLMQIKVPPNYGKRYNQLFTSIYPNLGQTYNLPVIDFFLDQVIVKPEWMMADGLHPKKEAQPWIANFVAQQLHPHLEIFTYNEQ